MLFTRSLNTFLRRKDLGKSFRTVKIWRLTLIYWLQQLQAISIYTFGHFQHVLCSLQYQQHFEHLSLRVFFTTVIHIKQSRTQGNVTHFSEHQSLLSTGKKRYGEFVRKKKNKPLNSRVKSINLNNKTMKYLQTHFIWTHILCSETFKLTLNTKSSVRLMHSTFTVWISPPRFMKTEMTWEVQTVDPAASCVPWPDRTNAEQIKSAYSYWYALDVFPQFW